MANNHPKALRQRVVEAYENGEGTQRELCKRFKLSMGAVNAWIQLARNTGSVEPPPGKGGNVSDITREDLKAILAEKCDLTHAEIAEKLQAKDVACSRSGVHRAMVRFGLTRKKKSRHDPERDKHEPERQAFRKKLKRLANPRIVVIDEAGIWSHMSRTHGYAPKGQRVESAEPLQPPVKQTVIAGLSTRGILAPLIVDGAMNGAIFVAWLEQELFPHMNHGDILVLDNLRVHKVEEVEAAAAKAHVKLLYLPPYSPDLSAIEPMWSKVKAFLRKIGATTKEELERAFCQALDAVTSENILNWFHHCGYNRDA